MGLSRESTGTRSIDGGMVPEKRCESDKVVALAGNPNVGKSTVFNKLTGMRQHTGNWPGKTIANAQGYCVHNDRGYVLVDIPGCYSLTAHSAEEEVARDYICFGKPDAVIVVCDAVCLERNMNLVLQILEVTKKVVVCVNLMDEAKKKGIQIDLKGLEKELDTPVVGTAARSGKGLSPLLDRLEETLSREDPDEVKQSERVLVRYPGYLEEAVQKLERNGVPRWLCVRLLAGEEGFRDKAVLDKTIRGILPDAALAEAALAEIEAEIRCQGISGERLSDGVAGAFVRKSEEICEGRILYQKEGYDRKDRLLDRLFTSRLSGFPIMFLVLLLIFWITITGANYPSQVISGALFQLEELLMGFFTFAGMPGWLSGMLVYGVYRVLAWVVSVMLPPMAIFFPLFTLLEDSGYLPRIAFNLDRCFKKCHACGKQALTMCVVRKCMRRDGKDREQQDEPGGNGHDPPYRHDGQYLQGESGQGHRSRNERFYPEVL